MNLRHRGDDHDFQFDVGTHQVHELFLKVKKIFDLAKHHRKNICRITRGWLMGEFLAGSTWLRPTFMHWLSVGESCFKVGDGCLDDKACVSRAGTCWFQSVSCLVSVGLLAAALVHLATVRRPISQHSALLRPALHNRSGWVRSGHCGAQLVPPPFALFNCIAFNRFARLLWMRYPAA